MSIKKINVGAVQNDGTGDQLRDAFVKVNENFEELESSVGSVSAANAAALRDRATHTGQQAIGTVAGLQAALDARILASAKGSANGVASLDGGGKVPESQLPAIAITDVFTVASQAAMLALTAERGDVAVRSDLNKTFALAAEPASALANWILLRTPTDAVLSVAGKTGAVTLTAADVDLGNVDNTSDANKPVSTAQRAALDLKAPLASPVFTGAAQSDYLTLGGTVASRLHYKNAINVNVLESGIGTLTGFGDSFGLLVQNSTGRFDIGTNGATRLTVDKDGNTTFSGSIRTIAHSTTAAAPSCVLQADGWVLRSTSSARYKKDVEPLDGAIADSIYSMRPVWYRSTSEADPAAWSWLGLIAEEVAAVEPRLAQWAYTPEDYVPGPERVVDEQIGVDSEGQPVYERKVYPGDPVLKAGAQKVPDGVQYERIVVPLIACVQAQRRQIEALEMRVAALEVPR